MKRRKCTAITNAGRECQAYAMHGTNPPLCWAHRDQEEHKARSREVRKEIKEQRLEIGD